MKNFDVVIVGGGFRDIELALQSDRLGFKTALLRPSAELEVKDAAKYALLGATQFYAQIISKEKLFGIERSIPPSINYDSLLEQKDLVVQNILKNLEWQLSHSEVKPFYGKFRFKDRSTIQVDGADSKEIISATYFILAMGSKPKPLAGIPFDGSRILSSDQITSLVTIPKSLAVIGGGKNGVELAQHFQTLGSQVTIVESRPHLISDHDLELSEELKKIFVKKGISVKTISNVMRIQSELETMRITLEGGQIFNADYILVTVGRERSMKNIGLDDIGLQFEGTTIRVNESFKTSIPTIFAVGDLITKLQTDDNEILLQGRFILETLKGSHEPPPIRTVPSAISTKPPIISMGLTSDQAFHRKLNPRELKIPFHAIRKAWADRNTDGFLKLVVSMPQKQILGVHAIGENVLEMVNLLTFGLQNRLTVKDLLRVVLPSYSYSEILGEALNELNTLTG